MNRQQYIQYHKECCEKMIEITEKKNADYSGFGDSAFSNFVATEKLNVTSTERGLLTRMLDKFSRIITFVNVGTLKVSQESIEDTLLDLANYCILMSGYIKSKKDGKSNSSGSQTDNG